MVEEDKGARHGARKGGKCMEVERIQWNRNTHTSKLMNYHEKEESMEMNKINWGNKKMLPRETREMTDGHGTQEEK
ncbi:hypothetical protein E2C01_037528 [Portunus trituberculatus]|uniref:Uncharacterized protein n=1 Tax=Portunus trituberculatus TaxID=210409 RepID=A0A5B7FHB9_PORTR|nr:hypothetical protein [Portunus trituberculatus]